MELRVISEICIARELPLLGGIGRRTVIAHIHLYLQEYRDDVLAHVAAERCAWMERLIESIYDKAPQIAALDDHEFRSVLGEFEKIVAILERLTSSWGAPPRAVH